MAKGTSWRVGRRARPWIALAAAACLLALGGAWWWGVIPGWRRGDPRARAAIAEGREHLQKHRPNLAIRAVSAIREGDPAEAEALEVKGLALATQDRVEEARRVLERAWRLRPRPMVAKVLAAIYFSSSESGRGFQMLQAAARLDPSDFRPWYGMGDADRLLDRFDAAALAFREALRRKPDHHESRVGLVEALQKTGHAEEAARWLEAALRERPDDPKVLLLAARQAGLEGRAEDEARLADRCLTLDPDNVEALLLRARSEQRAGHPDRALADAERAVALAPTDMGALHLLATIESAAGLKDRAAATIARFRRVEDWKAQMQRHTKEIEDHPGDPEPHWRLGRVAAEAGMTTLAVQSYRAALALDPNCQPARQGLLAISGASPSTPRP
jgi:tetratricopeptide (TPR) repeat protein